MYKHIKKPKDIWFIDIETEFDKKTLSPKKMTLVEYAEKTSILTVVAQLHTYNRETKQYENQKTITLLGSDCDALYWHLCDGVASVHSTWLVAHNAAFDFLIMRKHISHSYLLRHYTLVDTLAMAQYYWHSSSVVGRPASLGLDSLGSKLLGESKLPCPLVEGLSADDIDRALINNDDILLDYIKSLTEYNKTDVDLLHKLFFYLISGYGTTKIPREHIGTIDWALKQFVFPKLRLNIPGLEEYRSILVKERDDVFKRMKVDPATLRSNIKCAEYFESMGHRVPYKMGAKGPIPALAKTDPFIYQNENQQTPLGELVRARLLAKSSIELTRTESFLSTGSNQYHYHVMPSGTFTHRLSGKPGGGGNPLNLARDSPLRNFIRPAEGYKMFVFDFSGLELHIARWGAFDLNAMNVLRKGDDIYSHFICSLLKLDYDEFIDKVKNGDKEAGAQRFVGKTACLSLQYGVGFNKFCEATNASGKYTMTVEEAQKIVNFFRYDIAKNVHRAWNYFERYCINPDPTAWLRVFDMGQWQLFINFPGEPTLEGNWRWPSGRELRFPEKYLVGNEVRYKPMYPLCDAWRTIYGSAAFQAFCQSCANEVIDSVRGELLDAGYQVVSECYDELTVLVEEVTELSDEEIMQNIRDIATTAHYKWWNEDDAPPLKIDIATGPSYGEAKP